MTHKDGIESGNDEVQNQMVAHESVSIEEVKMLRQQMAEMYEAWMNGQAPPSSIREYLNVNMPFPIQVSTSDPFYPSKFGPYVNTSNTIGTSSVHLLNPPMMNNPLFMPTVQTNAIPQPTLYRELLDSKRVTKKLMKDKVIEIRNEEVPNVTNNPLPAHNKEHVVGMVDIYEDCEQTCRTKMESRDSKKESSMVLEHIQKAPIIVSGASSNFGNSRKLVLYVPRAVKIKEVSLNGQKLYIPGKIRTFGQNQESVKEPVVIQIATQLLMTNTKTVPWNYNKVVVTHKGNEIVEETNETRGLTRSGKCYAPEELRRDK
ncbi:hypothetical protein H5410_060955 [Solanum commersonii]|uniref:Uncharacterized protein n=1 Tax=Solanum commersonii TaxID=4109 RepID=A0A9J5W6F2_SOLCO|nr:hypothetical protein H5410_060955 [Solanum commersonii]